MKRCLILLALLTAGCTASGESRVCTAVDAESEVRVVWKPADFADEEAFTVRLCARDACKERSVTVNDDPLTTISVRLGDDAGPGTVPVRFTATADDGRIVLDDRAGIRLEKHQPNGESCAPTAWQGALRAVPGGGLVSAGGMPVR